MVSFRVACVAMAAVVVLAWGWLPLVEVEAGGDARFGIVLDAGSSGTRVYLFTWIDGDETATLTEVMHKKVSPGVSHYSENPEEAAKSVEQLLTHALKHIPEDKRAQVPVTLQATAGMRILPPEASADVLVELRKMLHGTGLVFEDHDARIVDGCSEGRYLFHAVNEALGKLGRSDDLVATLDLGGASTQIAMPLPNHEAGPYRFNIIACKDAQVCGDDSRQTERPRGKAVYTVSRLGFGMNEAYKAFLKDRRFTPESRSSPCLFRNQVDDTAEMAPEVYTGTGNYDECLPLVRKFVAAREAAHIYNNPDMSSMPPLNLDVPYFVTDNFPKVVIPTLEYNGKVETGTLLVKRTVADLQDEARAICGAEFESVWEVLSETKATRRKKICFGLAYVTSLLEMYGFPVDHEFNFALEINAIDMNWPLGAIIEQIHAVRIEDLSDAEAEL